MAVQIRDARDEDLTSLLPMWRAAVEASHGFLTSDDVDWHEHLVAGYLPQMGDLWVAVDEADAALGFIAQDAGEIHMLFVAPDAQGRGVGTALLEQVAQDQTELRLEVNEQIRPRSRSIPPEASGRSDDRRWTDRDGHFRFCIACASQLTPIIDRPAGRSGTRPAARHPPAGFFAEVEW